MTGNISLYQQRYPYMLPIAIGCSLLYWVLLVWCQNNGLVSPWYNPNGDGPDYALYAQNLLQQGTFTNGNYFYTRMPMYPMLMAFLLLFLPLTGMYTFLALLHSVAAGFGAWYAGKISAVLCNDKRAFYPAFILMLTVPLFKVMDYAILTESLCTTLFLITLWRGMKLWDAHASKRPLSLLIDGILLLIIVGLRPYMIVWMGLYAVYTALKYHKAHLSQKNVLLLLVPFMLFEAWWIPRNAALSGGKIIPFQKGMYAGMASDPDASPWQKAYVSIWEFTNATGEDVVFWKKGTFGSWVYGKGPFAGDAFKIPDHMLSSAYTRNDIIEGRAQFIRMDTSGDPAFIKACADSVANRFLAMKAAYIAEHPFDYQVTNRLRIVKHVFTHSGPVLPVLAYPEIKSKPVQLLLKIWAILTYLLITAVGLVMMVIWLLKGLRFNSTTALMACYVLLLGGMLSLYLRTTEFRIYHLLYPVLTLFTAQVLYLATRFITRRKNVH